MDTTFIRYTAEGAIIRIYGAEVKSAPLKLHKAITLYFTFRIAAQLEGK